MKKIKYLVLSLLCLATAVSCNDNNGSSSDTLKVAEQVVIGHVGQTENVTVEATRAFTAKWVGEEWGSVTVTANGISISVDENTTDTDRTARIVVSLDNNTESKVLKVIQNGSNPTTDDIIENVAFTTPYNDEMLVEINTTASEWEAYSSDIWITIETHEQAKEMYIIVEENKTNAERTGSVTVKVGSASKTISVTQPGGVYYILPYLDLWSQLDIDKVIAFETENNKSYYAGYDRTNRQHAFMQKSVIFAESKYTLGFGDFTAMLDPYSFDVLYSEVFYKWMADHGFVFNYSDPDHVYLWREGDRISVDAQIHPLAGYLYFVRKNFKPQPPVQPGPIPTFNPFPYTFVDWTGGKTEVKGWESNFGGTLAVETSESLRFESTGESVERTYWFGENGKLDMALQLLKGYSKAYWLQDMTFKWFLTAEFTQLLVDEGFEFAGMSESIDGARIYANTSKNILFLLGLGSPDKLEVNDPNKVWYTIMQFEPMGVTKGAANIINIEPKFDKNIKLVSGIEPIAKSYNTKSNPFIKERKYKKQ